MILFVLLLVARLLSLALYPVTDTTEARYAEMAHRILETGDWIMPQFDYNVPFWGKPPLSFWASALSMKILGWNEFAARLPHWILSIGVLWTVWLLAKRYSPGKECFAVAILASTALFYIAAGTVMTDMALALSTTLAMRGFIETTTRA